MQLELLRRLNLSSEQLSGGLETHRLYELVDLVP
jgi:hypothetical protein